MQQAHDGLAERLAELETEHAEVLIERGADAATLQDAHDNIRALEMKIKQHGSDRAKAEAAIVELQQNLHAAETELERATVQSAETTQSLSAKAEAAEKELAVVKTLLVNKEERVAELEDLLRAGLEQGDEISRLKAIIKTKDERIIDMQSRQTERQRSLDSTNETVADRDSTIASLHFDLDAVEGEVKRLERESVAAVKSIAAKDMIIGVLRDKLSTTNFEKDEMIAKSRLDTSKLAEAQEKVDVLGVELETTRSTLKHCQSEVDRLQNELTEIMGRAQANADDRRQAMESVERLEAERREWEEERASVSQVSSFYTWLLMSAHLAARAGRYEC